MALPSGFMIYAEDLAALSDLSNAQLGAVIRGLAAVLQGDTPPTFDGLGERIAFRFMEGKVRRDIEAYQNRCATNRANRARQRPSTIVDDRAPSSTIVDDGAVNAKEKARETGTVSEAAIAVEAVAERTHARNVNVDIEQTDEPSQELVTISEQHNAVFDAAQRAGFPMTAADMDKAVAFIADYTPEWVLEAVRRASGGTREQRCWRYVGGILRRWREVGGIDSENRPETARPVTRSGTPRLVTAQQYTQRQYTTEELDKLFDDLTTEELGQ